MPYKTPPKHSQFKPGQSGNPKGRTPGLSITAMIREELEKIPKGQKKPAKQLLVERILNKAIKEGDKEMIKLCWHYMDGTPLRKNEITDADGEPLIQKIEVVFIDPLTGKETPHF